MPWKTTTLAKLCEGWPVEGQTRIFWPRKTISSSMLNSFKKKRKENWCWGFTIYLSDGINHGHNNKTVVLVWIFRVLLVRVFVWPAKFLRFDPVWPKGSSRPSTAWPESCSHYAKMRCFRSRAFPIMFIGLKFHARGIERVSPFSFFFSFANVSGHPSAVHPLLTTFVRAVGFKASGNN